jgi:hypothetical protein
MNTKQLISPATNDRTMYDHMKRFARLPILALLALTLSGLAPTIVDAQENPSQAAPAGTEYYVGFMQNDDEAGGAYAKFMGLMITSQVATVGTVEIPGFETKTFSTRPGEISTVSIPRPFEHLYSEDTIGSGLESIIAAVRITSRAPVSVFVVNARHQSTFGYVAIPTSMWGTRYLPLTLPNGLGDRTSELMIVASQPDTWVRFIPSATTLRHQDQGIAREIRLEKGRTYFVQALQGSAGVADLSGSEISANKPIGVIAGHVRTPITLDGSVPSDPQAYATHQAAMMLPDSLWGSEFVSTPMRSSGDRFRVMPSREATVIVTHYGPAGIGRDTLALDAGEVRDLSTVDGQVLNGPVHWQSSAPAMVLQLRTGGRYGNPSESPAMMPLTALSAMTQRSAFVAIDRIADGAFTTHTLSLVVRVPGDLASDPAKAFRAIELDGTPIENFPANGAPRQVGSTDLFYASLPVTSGGHALVATNGVTFFGHISGDNGAVSRDSYIWPLPTWGAPAEFDYTAPYFVAVSMPTKGTVNVTVSDISAGYYSGVGDVQTSASTSGWIRTSFNAPQPSEPGVATFRAISDPSGPLMVTIRDRDGNFKDSVVQSSLCFKTATATEGQIEIRTTEGRVGTGTVELVANMCGDQADVRSITFGEGTVAIHLSAEFDDGQTTTTIRPNDRARLTVRASGAIPQGRHSTTIKIVVNDSLITLPVTVVVSPPSGVDEENRGGIALHVYPNPLSSSTTISIGRTLGTTASLTITDNLGRIVRTLGAAELAGRDQLVWDGRCSDGSLAGAGMYMLSVRDRGDRVVTGISVVR